MQISFVFRDYYIAKLNVTITNTCHVPDKIN